MPAENHSIVAPDALDGDVAVVTGGARGIGLAIATTLHRLGASTIVLDRDDAVPSLPEGIAYAQCDITDSRAVSQVFESIAADYGAVSILVNNAGIMLQGGFEDLEPEAWERSLDVNVLGSVRCARAVLPAMREHGSGRVIFIASSAGKTGGAAPGLAAYAASKAAVMSITRSLAREYAPHGVNINGVAPGSIDTGMLTSIAGAVVQSSVPLGRLGTPDDVAQVTAFLCTPSASFITGEIVDVNGGMLID